MVARTDQAPRAVGPGRRTRYLSAVSHSQSTPLSLASGGAGSRRGRALRGQLSALLRPRPGGIIGMLAEQIS